MIWLKRYFENFMGETFALGYVCSNCGKTWSMKTNYCPNCGARNEESDDDK